MKDSENFKKQIEELHSNQKEFTIFLKEPAQSSMPAATASSFSPEEKIKVYPCDELTFKNIKVNPNGRTKKPGLVVERVYSDFPSRFFTFLLEDIEKVEELEETVDS